MSSSWLRVLGLMAVSACLAAGCSSANKIDVGGTCILNSDCSGALVCTMGKCHDACHTSADCPTGQSCVKTNNTTICQLPAEAFCSPALPCGGTFVCASDQHCRAPCQSRTDCTTEQVCVSGVCAAPAELDPNNQLPQGGSVSAADAGANACQAGPGGYCWSTYTDPGATATWVTPPTTSAVHLFAQCAGDGGAGMVATLSGGAVIDLSQYDQMWFDANVPVGTMFAVGISQASDLSHSCSWWLTGAGSTRYTIDLRAAKYCNQTACGFDRSQVRSLAWAPAAWGTDSRVDMTLTALGFSRASSVSQPLTTADGASLGLNGWCWSLFSWGAASGIGATASWVTPPTANQVEVSLNDTSSTSQSGAAVELPSNLQDLTTASYIDIDASVLVAGATSFEVALLDMNDAYWMYTVGAVAGAHTYSIPIGNPTSRGTARGHAFNSQSVRLLRVETLWSAQETADITVTRIAIRGAGAGSKDAGAKDVAADIPVIVPDAGAKDLGGLGDTVSQQQNLMLWLNAATITGLADGASVTTWTDGSGKGKNVSATGTPPTYRVNQMNGLPIVRFDGGDDSLATASNFGLSGDPPFTVILAAKIASANIEWGTFWAFGNNARPGGCAALDWHSSNLCLATSFYWDADLQSGAFASYADTASIITVRRSPGAVGATTEILLNGAKQVVTGVENTPAIVDALFQVGAFGTVGGVTGGNRSIADVAELFVYGSTLSDGARAALECSLGAKYNITLDASLGCK